MSTPTTTVPPDAPISPEKNEQCFDAFIEHWAKARIDGPMQAIARYDDAAKQLVTVGGLMQALLVAAYSSMSQQPGAASMVVEGQMAALASFFFFLLLFFVCVVGVCWTQPKMDAYEVSSLLVNAVDQCIKKKDLVSMVKNWCEDIDGIRRRKKWWMAGASGSFIFCSLLMTYLLLAPFMRRSG